MDTFPSSLPDVTYSDEPPILVVATSETAMLRAERTVHASGFRIGGRLSLRDAGERLKGQGRLSGLWLEVDEDAGEPLDDFLDVIAVEARSECLEAVVSTTVDALDAVEARLREARADILVEADDVERVAALAVATTRLRRAENVNDVAGDKNAERLRQLSEEVSRIASTLARLSSGPAVSLPSGSALPEGEVPPLSGDTVRKIIRARRLRAKYFQEDLFADPAWDMMLDLLQAEIAQLRVPVSSLCIAAAVPATTALRWLKSLVTQNLFVRHADMHDGRRVFVELAPSTSLALRRYFAEVDAVPVI